MWPVHEGSTGIQFRTQRDRFNRALTRPLLQELPLSSVVDQLSPSKDGSGVVKAWLACPQALLPADCEIQ